MANCRTWPILAGLAMALGCTAAAVGQVPEQPAKPVEGGPPTARTDPNDPMKWNVEAMMDEAVQQIARRYNLNKAQEEYTRLLLTRRAKEFLKLHEDEVRKLLQENAEFRTGAKPATVESVMNWAERAAPVLQAAKDAILDGNKEWRQILTDEQKKTHDADLAQMNANFGNLDNAIKAWKEGKGPSLGPVKQTSVQQTPGAPQGVGQVSVNPASRSRNTEDNWKDYVDKFIQVYKLDEKQQNAALAGIHKDMLTQAKSYREKKEADFQSLDAQIAVLTKESKEPKAAERKEVLQQKRIKLEDPLRAMFVRLDERLKDLLDAKQRTGADPAGLPALKSMYDELSGARLKEQAAKGRSTTQSAATQPTSTQPVSTQPAATQPAATQPASQPAAVKPAAPPASGPAEPQAAAPPAKPAPAPEGKPKIPDAPKAEANKRTGE